MDHQYIRFFDEIGIEDIPLVGGKNASLGEMYQKLGSQGIKVPNGFAITAEAYRYLLDGNSWDALQAVLKDLIADDVESLARCGKKAREIVYSASIPADLEAEINSAYQQLLQQYGSELSLAVRSSATAEDLPTASFAGQQDTFLNITGIADLLESCKRCFASLFTDRAIHYRMENGFDHASVALSIGVMKMIRSDLASSGVMFSLDTESGFRDVVYITAAYGLGENVVQGIVEPDEFYVHKPTFIKGHRCVLRRVLGLKKIKMIYSEGGTREATKNVTTSAKERERFCLEDKEVLKLTDYAIKIEQFYSLAAGTGRPMDMEWAKDGLDGELYIVQARPETVTSQKQSMLLEDYQLQGNGEVIVKGHAVGGKIARGTTHVISNTNHLAEFRAGEVLVTDITSPDWEPIMKIASAIITNRGGRTCHAAIIARELGIPAVIGCDDATAKIETGIQVTVCCAEGDTGKVYRGDIPFHIEQTNLANLPRPKTKIMLNLGNPDLAFKSSFLPNDGVGLARMEFIINEYIKAHPMALLHVDQVRDNEEKLAIKRLLLGYSNATEYFVQHLSEGVATIGAAFYPKPVIVRLSDFKSNEYASLLGGRSFEPKEENPMIGFRGASRYIHPAYQEGFELECKALKRVRDEMGLTNMILMIPFCRTIAEGKKVLAKMATFGLKQGKNGLKIFVMCEIPNNVIQIDAFARLFDGFSIGSNDLTQLTLGVDRDSEIVAFDFDEGDEGVKEMIRMAVKGAKRNGCYSGICGQAPSDHSEMAEFLVELGIESLSLNPDTVIKTTLHVLEVEKGLQKNNVNGE
jgi:pyruvate,water dikinase